SLLTIYLYEIILMKIKNQINRRQFLSATGAITASLVFPDFSKLRFYHTSNTVDNYGSTEHFWYRKPPATPFVDSQNKNRAFAFTESEILLSTDNSHTWSRKLGFPEAKNITFSHVFDKDNVLFATQEKLYLCDKNISSYKEIIVKDIDG